AAMTPINYTFEQNTLAKNKHALATAVADGITYNFNHDQNGNLLSGPDFTDMSNIGTRRTTYNADNMPTTIYCTGTRNMVRYAYDGAGVRAKKMVRQGGQITYYVGKHFEVSGTGEVSKYIFAGAIRVAMIKGGHTYYFHKDHLGSTTAVTDETGTVVERIEYLPFGAMAYHDGERIARYLYTDQEWEPETGLYNYNARLYDPLQGRFITPDSLVQDPFDPQTLNRYTYVRNNPLMYVDPSGHFWGILIGAVFGALFGG
ncbi:MAG: hypothetical protein GY849_22535, partial [Deltaproteobacteria bacterium]|nr:hypothetical protein [Deltaproteobacteria bacterium]